MLEELVCAPFAQLFDLESIVADAVEDARGDGADVRVDQRF